MRREEIERKTNRKALGGRSPLRRCTRFVAEQLGLLHENEASGE